ncbi:hypothetical protein SUDANB176_07181 [Streptomyces sp. enrichment culture]|uniref:hypothetical protein n=1 Tax=Streptomyces sp. enrichment culture TaxID=1795815 RepID=UPI003F57D05A
MISGCTDPEAQVVAGEEATAAMSGPSDGRGAHPAHVPPLAGGGDLDRIQAGLKEIARAHGRMRSRSTRY